MDNQTSDDERPSRALNDMGRRTNRGVGGAMHESYLDDLLSSGDESSTQDDANLKLLPLDKDTQTQKRRKQVQFTPEPSSASAGSPIPGDESGEPRNVSKAIEHMLDSERDILSETFNEDLNHSTSRLMFSDDDIDDYGVPTHKGARATLYKDQKPSWKSGIKSLLHITAWWHVFPLVAVGLLVMWLAMKGLPWVLGGKTVKEYVRVSRSRTTWERLDSLVEVCILSSMLTYIVACFLVSDSPRWNQCCMERKLCQGTCSRGSDGACGESEHHNGDGMADGTLRWEYWTC